MQVQSNNDRQAIAGAALSKAAEDAVATARAWGTLAIQSIRAGDYKTAINRLQAGIEATSRSQHHGQRFDN